MEIFELRYFLEVARHENIHRASEKIRVSPPSLSKAIARLEDELEVKLFSREGRNIRLTSHGRVLQRKASEVVQLEESTRLEVSGHRGAIRAVIAGPEILLSKWGISLSRKIKAQFPLSTFEYHATDDDKTLEQVLNGEAHFGLVTTDAIDSELTAKPLGEAHFQTYVGVGHPLHPAAKSKKVIPVEKVLQHPFASPSQPLLGKVGLRQSLDGWRDDQFPRRVEYLTSSLKLLEELVTSGKAIAYLPDYYCENLSVEVLKISGCPYSCSQKVKLVLRKGASTGWMNQVL